MLLGATNAFLAVAAGAFGAHGLRDRLSDDLLAVYQTGAQYHMTHSLALVLVGAMGGWLAPRSGRVCGWLFFAGIVLFAGTLYALAMTGARWLGAVTPLGGVCFLSGWVALFVAAYGGRSNDVGSSGGAR